MRKFLRWLIPRYPRAAIVYVWLIDTPLWYLIDKWCWLMHLHILAQAGAPRDYIQESLREYKENNLRGHPIAFTKAIWTAAKKYGVIG